MRMMGAWEGEYRWLGDGLTTEAKAAQDLDS